MYRYVKSFFGDKNKENTEISKEALLERPLPTHVAIIMDGNGRWATKRGLPRSAGHRAGMETLKKIVETSLDLGLKHLTVYAFSTENWKRPREEINSLMHLLVEYIDKELNKLKDNGVCIRTLGHIEELPEKAVISVKKAIKDTQENSKLYLQIALNYGSRREIIDAVKVIAIETAAGKIKSEDIEENIIEKYLYTAGLPDPDLMIRTSGEMRLSNFLLWQSAYTEFWSTPVLWPDFTQNLLYEAIYEYQHRKRRLGGI